MSKKITHSPNQAADPTLTLPHSAQAESEGVLGAGGGNPAGGAEYSVQSSDFPVEGASASNTAPSNCINKQNPFQLLRLGIDSLYLSFQGILDLDVINKIEELKLLAQSDDPVDQARAVLVLGEHEFEVKDRGKGKFQYVLSNNWFYIQIPGLKASKLPSLYVQISSELLTVRGFHFAASDLLEVAKGLTKSRVEKVTVSRIDICADFMTNFDLQSIRPVSWVTRVTQKDTYYHNNKLTGWVFGKGGQMMARLYDKTLEAEKRHKKFLYPFWLHSGWDYGKTVWRLEFQIKREALAGKLGDNKISSVIKNLGSLWSYATQNWLRLTVPNSDDKTQTRWPTHQLWKCLQSSDWDFWFDEEQQSSLPILHAPKARPPNDTYLFKNGISFLSSYMAKEGIRDIDIGYRRYLEDAHLFHLSKGKPLSKYLDEKRSLKARLYNTTLLRDPEEARILEWEHEDQEYLDWLEYLALQERGVGDEE